MNFQSMKHLKRPLLTQKQKYDMLEEIYNRQLETNSKFNFWKHSDPEYLTKEYVLALNSELDELLSQINWKIWKKTKKPVDIEELRYELIDILIFTITLMQVWKMTPRDIMSYFIAKNGENNARIKAKY